MVRHFPVIHPFFIFVLVILLIQTISPVSAAQSVRPFTWVDDDDYAPFIYKDVDGRPQGIYRDIMVEIFKRMDIPLKYGVFPWRRAQKYAEEGQADAMITALTKERRRLFIASDPIFINSERVFARSDNPQIKAIMSVSRINDLNKFKIVDTIGSGWAEEHFKDMNIIWAPTQDAALNLLASGRVDIYIMGKYPGLINIKTKINKNSLFLDGFKKIIVGPHSLSTINYSLLIRKTSEYASLLPRFNKTLAQIKKDGTYQRILNRYFAADKVNTNTHD